MYVIKKIKKINKKTSKPLAVNNNGKGTCKKSSTKTKLTKPLNSKKTLISELKKNERSREWTNRDDG